MTNTKLLKKEVHKLPIHSKIILLSIILHKKHIKKKYLLQRNKLRDIYQIYLEICKKIFVDSLDKKHFSFILLDLQKLF